MLKKLYSCVLFLTAIFFISSKEVSSCVSIIYENIFWKHETISTHMSLHCSFWKQFMKHCKKYTAKTWYIFSKNFGQQSGLNDLNPGTYRHYGDFFFYKIVNGLWNKYHHYTAYNSKSAQPSKFPLTKIPLQLDMTLFVRVAAKFIW